MADTEPEERASADGGPGWRIREQRSRSADPLNTVPVMRAAVEEPMAPPPPPPPPAAPVPESAPRKSRRTLALYGVTALVLFGAAGGGAVFLTGGHPSTPSGSASGAGSAGIAGTGDPTKTFLAAVQRTDSESFRADLTMLESFSVSGPAGETFGALGGAEFSIKIHVDQATSQRAELREEVTAPGVDQTAIAVLWDGTVYLSTDNGATYQTVPASEAAIAQLSPKSPLEFLQMVGTVTQTGNAEVNSVPVTEYHADLDPVKASAFLKNELGRQNNPVFGAVVGHIGVSRGTLDAGLDWGDHILTDTGSLDMAIDLGAVSASDAGATLNLHETFTGNFSDYGLPVTITRPAAVTGSASL